jgi:glycosyltransferase involved in cell wall biosynthesis
VTGVVYVANSGKIGGGNRVMMDMVTGIDRSRFAPVVVVPEVGSLLSWAKHMKVPARVLPAGGSHREASNLRFLRRVASLTLTIVRSRSRIVHAMAPACYHVAGLAGILASARRVCHLEFPPGSGEIEWAFRFRPDLVLACYEKLVGELADTVKRTSPSTRLVSLSNAIDTALFVPPPDRLPERVSVLRQGARHVVLIVGHLSEVKGHPVFLHAAAKVAARIPDVAFLALGDETPPRGYRQSLERLATDLGVRERVRFLGWRDDVREVLWAADVLVLPSLAEGLPLVVLEAMACGRPVIATSVNGVPEAVVDGVSGLLIPPGDAAGLATSIERLLLDPELAREMGVRGRLRVEEQFSLGRFLARVEALYAEVATTRPLGRDGPADRRAERCALVTRASGAVHR